LKILVQRNFWGIALPRFLADPTWGTLTFWVPLYLSTIRHFDLKQIALFAWMPFLAADFGRLFSGVIVLDLQRRGVNLINARRCAFTLGAFLMTGMAFVGFVSSPYAAIALLSLGGFAHQTLSVTVINSMLIEQINDIDFEPLERTFDGPLDVVWLAVQGHRARPRIAATRLQAEFRGDDYLLAKWSERFTH
jgi:hypothetical protein